MEIDEAIERIDKNHCKEVCSDNCMYGRNFCEYRMAIDALKFKQEYQAKVQKCIERMKDSMKNEHLSIKGEPTDTLQKAFITTLHYAIDIIKEELGVMTND